MCEVSHKTKETAAGSKNIYYSMVQELKISPILSDPNIEALKLLEIFQCWKQVIQTHFY